MTATSDSQDATPGTRQAIRDGLDARSKASQAAQAALSRTKDGLDQARGVVTGAYASSRDRAADAYAAARGRATSAGKGAGDGVDAYPLAALLGGVAIGAAVGALLPRTEREAEMLGPVGKRLRAAALEAADAARQAGRDKLGEVGLTPDHARETVRTLLDNVVAAAGSATEAAVGSVGGR